MKLTKELKEIILEALENIYFDTFKEDEEKNFDWISDDNAIAIKILKEINKNTTNFPLTDNQIAELFDIIENAKQRGFEETIIIYSDFLGKFRDILQTIFESADYMSVEIWDLETLAEYYYDATEDADDTLYFEKKLTNITPFKTDINFSKTFNEIDKIFFKKNQNICVLFNEIIAAGKTTAAIEYAKTSEKFDHIAYINIISDFRIDFIRAFANDSQDENFFNFDTSTNFYTNFYHLIAQLEKLDGTNLLIIDNITKKEQIALINTILRRTDLKILLVSEFKFFGFPIIELPEVSRKFIYKKLKNIDEKFIDEIFDKIGNNLFFANFLDKQLQTDKSLSINTLKEKFLSKEKRIYHLNDLINNDISKPAFEKNKLLLKYVMVFFENYVKKLTPQQSYILFNLAVLPSDYYFIHELEGLLRIDSSEHSNFIDDLLDLKLKGWIEIIENKIYFPRPLKLVTQKKLKPKASNIRNLLKEITAKINSTPQSRHYFLKILSSSIYIINNIYGISTALIDAVEETAMVLDSYGYEDTSKFYYNIAGLMAEDYFNNKALKLKDITKIAFLYQNADNFEKSLFYMTLRADEIERIHGDTSLEYGFALYSIALVYDKLNDYDSAIFYIEEATSIVEKILDEDDPALKEIIDTHILLSKKISERRTSVASKKFIKKFFKQ